MKICPGCKKGLSREKFGKDQSRKDGLHRVCRGCVSERGNRRYHENPRKRRNFNLLRDYGITLAEFEEMIRRQDDKCAICEDPLPAGRNSHLDHNHQTGKIRGILCAHCNRSLGGFKECPRRLQAAIDYLRKHFD